MRPVFIKILRALFPFLPFEKGGRKVDLGGNAKKDYAILDNIEKAKHGGEFENEVSRLLSTLQGRGVVDRFTRRPIYSQCFRPDFEIHVGGTVLVVDTTTTVRTDREKGKLWDAYWAKKVLKSMYLGRRVEAVTLVQKTTGKERSNYEVARKYIEECSRPYDAVDYVMSLEDFVRYVYKLKGLEPPV